MYRGVDTVQRVLAASQSVLIRYKVTVNTELAGTESLPLGEIRTYTHTHTHTKLLNENTRSSLCIVLSQICKCIIYSI